MSLLKWIVGGGMAAGLVLAPSHCCGAEEPQVRLKRNLAAIIMTGDEQFIVSEVEDQLCDPEGTNENTSGTQVEFEYQTAKDSQAPLYRAKVTLCDQAGFKLEINGQNNRRKALVSCNPIIEDGEMLGLYKCRAETSLPLRGETASYNFEFGQIGGIYAVSQRDNVSEQRLASDMQMLETLPGLLDYATRMGRDFFIR